LTVAGCGGDSDAAADDAHGGLPTDALVSSDGTTSSDTPLGAPDESTPADAAAGCDDGDRRCGALGEVLLCMDGVWSPREICTTGRVCRDGQCVISSDCTPGDVRGCASETARAVCNAAGTAFSADPCPAGQFCVQGVCGGQLCQAGTTRCRDLDTLVYCSTDGQSWGNPTPCPEGAVCNDGSCVSGCEAEIKLSSYIGCEYWTVDLDNYPDPFTRPMPFEVPHSVVISNPSHAPAYITFDTKEGGPITFADPWVQPNQARAFEMPRQDVDGSGITWKSIRIRSSMPINAYQFNPFNNAQVFSNDGSLLLPANTLGRRYIAASYPSGVPISLPGVMESPAQSGYVTIVATDGGTTRVTVRVTGDVVAGPDVPALTAGQEHTFELEQYQVLNLQAAPAVIQLWPPLAKVHDLTGTLIESTKPVAVFGGHEEAVIAWKDNTGTGSGAGNPDEGSGSCCADHLEEQLLPVQVWTNDVLCAKAPPRGGEADIWRVFSGADGNRITTAPSIPGLDGQTLAYGQWVEVKSHGSFEVHGTGPVMAVQYTVSQEQTDQFVGDPAMIMAVPVGQYREDYRVLVPDGYSTDWVTVIRPAGEQIVVDGLPTAVTFQPFGSGQWEVGWVQLEPGVHHLSAGRAFGLIAFGWDNAVSYGYPAGLNLRAEDWTPGR
jgi:hypothetical protein